MYVIFFSDLTSVQSTKATVDSSNQESAPLSFSKVIEMVEKGEKLPGVEELNIEPTNSQVTESQCNRLKKPWEN